LNAFFGAAPRERSAESKRADRKPELLAVSDLMISRLQKLLGFRFIGSDNSPPSLVNDAYLFESGQHQWVSFAHHEVAGRGFRYIAGGLHVYSDTIPNAKWDVARDTIDLAVSDFVSRGSPTTHFSRLIFQFDFDSCQPVARDLRLVLLAPIFERFAGTLVYPHPEDYPGGPVAVSEYSPHPSGIELAWEGEYTFAQPVAVAEMNDLIAASFNVELRRGWSTRLPEVAIDNVWCRFSITPRFF
jgi:hypothetical protein